MQPLQGDERTENGEEPLAQHRAATRRHSAEIMGNCFSCCCCEGCCCCQGGNNQGDHETCCDCCGDMCSCFNTCCGGCCTICKNCTEMGVEVAKTTEHVAEAGENVTNMPTNLVHAAATGIGAGIAVGAFQVKRPTSRMHDLRPSNYVAKGLSCNLHSCMLASASAT